MLAFVGAASAAMIDTKFMEWIGEHGRSYGTVEEFEFRAARFAEAERQIVEHNSQNG